MSLIFPDAGYVIALEASDDQHHEEAELLFETGWDLFLRRLDKQYSFTDCLSFALMDRRDIERALASDRHFEQTGHERLPK